MHPFFIFKLRRCAFLMTLGKTRKFDKYKLRTLYLGSSGNWMLNRACIKKVVDFLKQLGNKWSVQVDMVKTILFKLQYLFHPHKDVYLNCVDICWQWFKSGFEGFKYLFLSRMGNKFALNDMSGGPKSTSLNKKRTTGSAKGSNSYAARGFGVAANNYYIYCNNNSYGIRNGIRNVNINLLQWSKPAKLSSRTYSTATGSRINVLDKLEDLRLRSLNNPDLIIDRDLYKTFVLSPELLMLAYNRLKSKKGMMTEGIDSVTLDGINMDWFNKTLEDLSTEKFKFSPARRIYIDKANGKKRPLTIGSPRDKLVQEVMRIILEAIYEPLFLNVSHGFRPGRSCHTALRQIFTSFKGCTWWIEGDFKACFDSIPHDKLMLELSLKIKDQRFLQLIRKALNAGYLYSEKLQYDIVGIPQGSIISPILANIYLHKLDKYIAELKLEFDSNSDLRKRNPAARRAQYLLKKAKLAGEDTKVISKLAVNLRTIPNKLRGSTKRIMYIRYADDWIVAVDGSFTEAKNLLNTIRKFCSNELSLTLSEEKTSITNSYKNHILFLGTNIKHSTHVTLSAHKGGHLQRNSGFLVLTVPMDRIYKKLQSVSLMINHRGVTRISWLPITLREMIHSGNSIMRGYLNYYSFAHNMGKFAPYIYYIIRDTLARTIAHKMNLGNRAKVFKKYGNNISIYDMEKRDKNNRPILLAEVFKPSYKLNVWDFKTTYIDVNIKTLYVDYVSKASLDKLVCLICESKIQVEMHHIRMMKDLKPIKGTLDYLMARANRKQIPLCRSCHMKYHNNKLTIPSELIKKYEKKSK